MQNPDQKQHRLVHCLTALAVATLFSATAVAQEKGDAPEIELTPVVIVKHVAKISAENTSVEFVGTHVGDDPKPRLGGFREFAGTIELDEDDSTIKAIKVGFKINSIWTEFEDLTKHLMNADFFEADEYPNASFASKKVSAADDEGRVTVTGDLTIHGTTGEMSFECLPKIAGGAMTLQGKFTIDRTKFGLDKKTEGIEPVVTIEVNVGLKTEPRKSAPAIDRSEEQLAEEEMASMERVQLKLPNMLCGGCAASVRTDLTAVTSLSNIETDVNAQTCQFNVAPDVDLDTLLNELATKNRVLADWSRQK